MPGYVLGFSEKPSKPKYKTTRYLSHEFLGSKDKFMIDQPARFVFKQTAVWVNHHRLKCIICGPVEARVVAKGDERKEGFQDGSYFSTSLKRKRINN